MDPAEIQLATLPRVLLALYQRDRGCYLVRKGELGDDHFLIEHLRDKLRFEAGRVVLSQLRAVA